MRVALLTDGIFPYMIGGMQKHSYYLVKYFAENGVNVDLYHSNHGHQDIHKLELFTEKQKEFIHPVVLEFPRHGKLPGHYLRESYAYSSAVFNALMAREPADFIYVKGFAGWKFFEEKRNGRKLPPSGVNFHGYEMFQPAFGLRYRLEAALLRGPVRFNSLQADYVFSYGGKISGIIEKLGVKKDRIITIPTGIDPHLIRERPTPSGPTRRFVFVGRDERRKGLEELYSVLRELKNNKNFNFEFIGPIASGRQLSSPCTYYTGTIMDQDKLLNRLDRCDVLVCPSYAEGMPNVIMEGMARGLAVIASDVGAVSCMLNTDNGWLIPPGDTASLKMAMSEAIEMNDECLNELKMHSLKTVRHFQWDQIGKTTIREIEKRIN